jgi:hypothetical protein
MVSASRANAAARAAGSAFEQSVGRSFEGYASQGVAYLDFMPIPTRAIRVPGFKGVAYVPCGHAPFDVYGHRPRMVFRQPAPNGTTINRPVQLAVMVGAELKTTKDHEKNLSIVHPESDSHGLEYHQLYALALLARMGGVARIVWDNGGQVGVASEDSIVLAYEVYEQSLASERRGNGKGPRGSRSIPWTAFKPVDYGNVGGVICLDWLKVEKTCSADE